MKTIIKSTLKLLFRNPGFWFFILITPVVSTIILNVESNQLASYEQIDDSKIIEIEKVTDKVAYYGGSGKYIVKVYDASQSELSEYFLNKLVESGTIDICRVKANDFTLKDMDKRLKTDGYDDRMGAAIFIGADFDKDILKGDYKDNLRIYNTSDDERFSLLENTVKLIIGQINMAKSLGGDNIIENLDNMNANLPTKELEVISATGEINLTNEQLDQKALIGYAFAILTLGFVFIGILVSHTIISEQNAMVLTRIKLTDLNDFSYYGGKIITGAILSLMLTMIMGLTTMTIGTEKLGMNRPSFLLVIFMIGLIFSSISLIIGVFLGNVMSANVCAFSLWSMSSMLAGLYFPLDSTTKFIKALSYMMPQKWFMDAVDLIMAGDNRFYFMILCVTISYMIITFGLGSVGIKLKNYE